jgi:gliding motility-associated-like protein
MQQFNPFVSLFPLRRLVCAFYLLHITFYITAQTPNNQDCGGAIPVCQEVYNQANSFSGEGNIIGEINPINSCLGVGERNCVWYTMTIQQDGLLNFTITPNSANDDYDWAVFNLTNAGCADIATDPGLEASCNFSGNTGNSGITGANGQTTGVGSSQNEDPIPVLAGETYYIIVGNFNASQSGYTLDMTASTATIFDNVTPTLKSVTAPVFCTDNSVSFEFSENMVCSSVSQADFGLSGPGGPYTITGFSGGACDAGANFERDFSLTFSPAISQGGTYTLEIAGSVTDLCGNEAPIGSGLDFDITAIPLDSLVTPDLCGNGVGTATVITLPGSGPFNYSWSPNVSNTDVATNLAAGTYTVTVTDIGGGCPQNIDIIVQATPSPVASFRASPLKMSYLDPYCEFTENSDGSVTWLWDFGDGSSTEIIQNPVHTFPGTGDFPVTLTITNADGCTDDTTIIVTVTFLSTIYIPNAFTPGRGLLNDTFGPYGEGIAETNFNMRIFDRWGRQLFYSFSPLQQWDGTDAATGRMLPQGVYVYNISLFDLNGEAHTYIGSITLLER